MTTFHKNESIAAKRRCAIVVYDVDGVTPLAKTITLGTVPASVALTGTHHATISSVLTGTLGNTKTISLAADGTGTGSLTVSGNAYTFHYATGTTTMANFVSAAFSVFTFSGHTPADVLVSTGDTQGPLALTGGIDFPLKVRDELVTYGAVLGTLTNAGVDGVWIYEATQAETNKICAELDYLFQHPTYFGGHTYVDIDDGYLSPEGANAVWDSQVTLEQSLTPADFLRLIAAAVMGPVSDFRTTTQTVKNLDASKTRFVVTIDGSGRLAFTLVDAS